MSTNEKPNIPELPPEPPELVKRRDALITELDKSAKSASGIVQQVMRKTHALLVNTQPGKPLDEQLYQDVKDAFLRYSKDTATGLTPQVIMDCIEWLQAYVASMGFPAAPEAGAAAPAPAATARQGGTGPKDGFDSGPARAPSLGGDAPLPPAGTLDPKTEQQQLESFKAWMKNPALGKVKG